MESIGFDRDHVFLFDFWFLIQTSEIILIKHHKIHTQVCVPILNFWHWLITWIYEMLKKGRCIIAKSYARIPNGEHDIRRMYTLQTYHILD